MMTISHTDIKRMLLKKQGGGEIRPIDMGRDLVGCKTSAGHSDMVLWISGSPPRGYCITGNGIVSLYNTNGKRFKIWTSALVVPDDQVQYLDGRKPVPMK